MNNTQPTDTTRHLSTITEDDYSISARNSPRGRFVALYGTDALSDLSRYSRGCRDEDACGAFFCLGEMGKNPNWGRSDVGLKLAFPSDWRGAKKFHTENRPSKDDVKRAKMLLASGFVLPEFNVEGGEVDPEIVKARALRERKTLLERQRRAAARKPD